MPKRGKFIVLDGMDGCGKGTQLALLRGKLEHLDMLYTREPGGKHPDGSDVLLAEEIRSMLLRKDGPPTTPLCDLLLFWASRAAHVAQSVAPHINSGGHAISDRYDSSTFAFQLCGERQFGQLQDLFLSVRTGMGLEYWPDAYIFLDLPAEVAYERMKTRVEQEESRFDAWPLEKHQLVREGFQEFGRVVLRGCPRGVVYLVDANRPPDEVHKELSALVLKIFGS